MMSRASTETARAERPSISLRSLVVVTIVGVVAAANLYLAARSVALIVDGVTAVDWVQYVEAATRVGTDRLYEISGSYAYRYSPILAMAFGPISVLGAEGWRLLHVIAALALPSWPLRIATLVSWPFWYDVQTGNVLVFVLLAAAWALRGNRVGIGAYLALTLLVPRPLMLPVAAWILWKQPAWRLPFVAAFALQAVAVVAIGSGAEWIATLVAAGEDAGLPSNVGPSRFIGVGLWLAIGLPLALWLTAKGRLGLASLASSPYWLPYYLVMPLLELVRWGPRRSTRTP
jgi:hypothetical protein